MADTKDKIKQQRMEEYAKIREELLAEGYIEYNAVISIVKANIMTFVTALPFCIMFGILFWVCDPETENSFLDSFFINYSLLIVSFIISIPVHELLHGAGWLISCKNGRKSINFGVIWKYLTPYCHCSEALKISQYYIGLLTPFVILGVLPCVISIITGSVFLLIFGMFGILGAGGDNTIGFLLLKYIRKNALVLDHPSECGCAVFAK